MIHGWLLETHFLDFCGGLLRRLFELVAQTDGLARESGREVMRVNVQGDGIGASQTFPGLLDQSHGLFHTRPGTIETGCFKPLFHGFVRPGADIEPGIKREIHPRVTQRKHGAAVMPALPVRYEPVREPLS